MELDEETNRREETEEIKESNGREKRKCQETKKRSIEKWKIEDAPTRKKMAARIRTGEHDVSKNPVRERERESHVETEMRNT